MKTDLFGNKVVRVRNSRKRNPTLFDDYDGFVDKFKEKKTTDDCFTPPDVYEAVLSHVIEKCGIKGRQIIRPFWPGNCYETFDYPEGCVVVDNPPFSILSKIVRFYTRNDVDFFLFANHMTLFSSRELECTRVVVGADVVYENGAKVKTSFLSNLFGDSFVMTDPSLYELLTGINESMKMNLPRYAYPPHVLTVHMAANWAKNGISVQFGKGDMVFISELDSQKAHNKSIFGNGYLLSDRGMAEKAAADIAAEKAAAEKADVIEWELSEREKQIIKNMNDDSRD